MIRAGTVLSIVVAIAIAIAILPVASRDVASVSLVLLLSALSWISITRGIQRRAVPWLVAGAGAAGAGVYALLQPGEHHVLGIGAGLLLLVLATLHAKENERNPTLHHRNG